MIVVYKVEENTSIKRSWRSNEQTSNCHRCYYYEQWTTVYEHPSVISRHFSFRTIPSCCISIHETLSKQSRFALNVCARWCVVNLPYFILCTHSSSWCRAHDNTGMPVHNITLELYYSTFHWLTGISVILKLRSWQIATWSILEELVSIVSTLQTIILRLNVCWHYLLVFT